MKVYLLLLAILMAILSNVQAHNYPMFKQCDSRWRNDMINTKTICRVGCLMSSVSMGLNGYNIPVNGTADANPGTLNNFLRHHHGYVGNSLIYAAVTKINPSRIKFPSDGMRRSNNINCTDLKRFLDNGRVLIANVHNGRHWVLATGTSNDCSTVYVNDPGYHVNSYSNSEIGQWRIYDMH
eukprot:TRINITY_DN2677_c0_g1_i1.p1 TRINITY_DN2677_c0_g1~~TRINITY_DN2677_c0_g1_i1.p1  ORF type:complete len:190 (+),score=38.30 TRINITY_DN2677_c0_g1_i1:28-570(+)